jgi:hypothetical protein
MMYANMFTTVRTPTPLEGCTVCTRTLFGMADGSLMRVAASPVTRRLPPGRK